MKLRADIRGKMLAQRMTFMRTAHTGVEEGSYESSACNGNGR
jgi:hypothetical protein